MQSELLSEIKELIGEILNKEHVNPIKHRIHETNYSFQFACPYCGDSERDAKKARAHIFMDSLGYHCYNCEHHTNVYHFFKDYGVKMQSTQDMITVLDYIKNSATKGGKWSKTFEFDVFQELVELGIPKVQFMKLFHLWEITPNTFAYSWLKDRLLHNHLNTIVWQPKTKNIWVLNMNRNDIVIGAQMRTTYQYAKSKYYTYDIQKIYEETGLVREIENIPNWSHINQVSTLFNILKVDLTTPFNVFEGPFDSMFMKNSIATCTAGKDVEIFNELPTTRFVYDNDRTGLKKSTEKVKDGKQVFMWTKFLKDFKIREHIKDLNDLILYAYKNNDLNMIKSIPKYFSKTKFDLMHV